MLHISPSSYVNIGDHVYVRYISDEDGRNRRFKWSKGLIVYVYKEEIEEVGDNVKCDIHFDDGECAIETVLYDSDFNNIDGLDCWRFGDTMTKLIEDLSIAAGNKSDKPKSQERAFWYKGLYVLLAAIHTFFFFKASVCHHDYC